MEIVRPDFLVYIDQVRNSLAAIRAELGSAKLRDDVDCLSRVLETFSAEHALLAEQAGTIEAGLAASYATLAELVDEPELAELRPMITAWSADGSANQNAAIHEGRQILQQALPGLIAIAERGNPRATALTRELLRGEMRLYDDLHARRPARAEAPTGATGQAEQPFTAAQLEAYLREIFPTEPDLRVATLHNLPGGRSKETTLIALAGVRTLPPRIVMRRDIVGGLVQSKTPDEFSILQVVSRLGKVPVPTPLHCEHDASRLGSSFILVAAMPGRSEGEYFPEIATTQGDKVAIGLQLARMMGALHSIDIEEFRGSSVDIDMDNVANVTALIEQSYAMAREVAPSRVHLEMAYAWLKRNLHLANGPTCLIHCDVGLHNILIHEGSITALLDWELATLGTPTRDIAKIMHIIESLIPREDFIREYLDAGGSTSVLDPEEMRFYAVLGYMMPYQRSRYANQIHFSGLRSNAVMANAGYDFHARFVRLLSGALRGAYPNLN